VTAVRFRALVLAAGRGERLRPLTDRLPKPLLPVAGQPVAAHTLARLAAAGCEAAAINLHHQGELIRKRFGGRFGAMPLTYSEEPERLGTLGALWPLRDFLAAAELVVVINGDSLCRWPVKTLLRPDRYRRPSGNQPPSVGGCGLCNPQSPRCGGIAGGLPQHSGRSGHRRHGHLHARPCVLRRPHPVCHRIVERACQELDHPASGSGASCPL
jgi:hypothetical protein